MRASLIRIPRYMCRFDILARLLTKGVFSSSLHLFTLPILSPLPLFSSFSISHSLSPSHRSPSLPVRSSARWCRSSRERAVCQSLQARLPTTWIVKTSGRHPARRSTVKQAFAYRIFDLRPGDALAATGRAASRHTAPIGVNAEIHVYARCTEPSEPWVTLRSSTFVLTSGQLPGRLPVREMRSHAFERTARYAHASYLFIAVYWYTALVDDPSLPSCSVRVHTYLSSSSLPSLLIADADADG